MLIRELIKDLSVGDLFFVEYSNKRIGPFLVLEKPKEPYFLVYFNNEIYNCIGSFYRENFKPTRDFDSSLKEWIRISKPYFDGNVNRIKLLVTFGRYKIEKLV